MTVAHLGRDLRSGLQPGDRVEIVDETSIHQHPAEPLRQVDVVYPGVLRSGRRQRPQRRPKSANTPC